MSRVHLVALCILTLSTGGLGLPDPAQAEPTLALVGATLVDGTGAELVPDAVVVVEGERITCAGSKDDCPVPEGAETRDLAGHFLTPGLIDAHVHFSQTGWADGRPDALDVRDRYPYPSVVDSLESNPERFFRAYVCSGVTAVFDVGGYPWTFDLPARAEDDPRAPRVRSAGPLLSTLDFWLNLAAERQFIYLDDEASAATGVEYLAARGASAVKVWFIPVSSRDFDPMAAAVEAAGREADARGLPLIVHATGLREAKVALEAGAEMLVHSVWDQEVDEEFLRLAEERGTIYVPTLTVPAGYQRMYEAAASGEPPEVDDPLGCVDAETQEKVRETAQLEAPVDADALAGRRQRTEERERIGTTNLVKVHEAGIPVAMGTDAGNPLTLHGPAIFAELEAMQAAGLTPLEVIETATRGGARALGREAELGTVEAGKLADLLVLARDPSRDVSAFRSLRHVVRGGVLQTVDELAAPGRGAK